MSNDATRDAFEAEANKYDLDLNRFKDGYSDCNTDYGWIFWQAATLAATAELGAARVAVKVMKQALAEMSHAHFNPNWFTKGSAGATAQFLMWRDKGYEAAAEIRMPPTATPQGKI